MGTTLTPNLGLIKPDTDEDMANWLTQWAATADAIDTASYVAFGKYTPTWQADTTNPTLGPDGYVSGRWIRLGPKLVITYIEAFAGTSGFSAGSGTYAFDLPFNLDAGSLQSGVAGRAPAAGKAHAQDPSTGTRYTGTPQLRSTALDTFFICSEGGSSHWTNAAPFTWSNFDRISMYVVFMTSDGPV